VLYYHVVPRRGNSIGILLLKWGTTDWFAAVGFGYLTRATFGEGYSLKLGFWILRVLNY